MPVAVAETTTLMKAVGFAGQGLFVARILVQWIASERARRSVVPPMFWWLSVGGSVLLLAYAAATRDPVFVLGPLVNLFIYVRNIMLMRAERRAGAQGDRAPAPLRALVPAAIALALFVGVIAYSSARAKGVLDFSAPWFWLVVGFCGQAVWVSRFPLQWWLSERQGRSVLPAAFWWISIVGAVLLLSYAAWRGDPVFILAYALNPIPYARNLMLIYRARAEAAGAAAGG